MAKPKTTVEVPPPMPSTPQMTPSSSVVNTPMPPTPMPGGLGVDRSMIGSRDGSSHGQSMMMMRENIGSRDGTGGVKFTHAPPMTQALINRQAIISASPLEGLTGSLNGMI